MSATVITLPLRGKRGNRATGADPGEAKILAIYRALPPAARVFALGALGSVDTYLNQRTIVVGEETRRGVRACRVTPILAETILLARLQPHHASRSA
jgi:hypothetical protein